VQADFTTDDSHAFLLVVKRADALPDWVKESCSKEDADSLSDSSFADCHSRLFPIHCKEAAWMSAVSSYSYGIPPGPWSDRLKAACHAYGIMPEVTKAIEALRPSMVDGASKEASEEVIPHALTLESVGGNRDFYPLGNAHQIRESSLKMAADSREKRFPVGWIRLAARNLCKAAASVGVTPSLIHPDITRLGEERLPCPETVKAALAERAAIGVPEGGIELYAKAANDYMSGDTDLDEAEVFWETADNHFQIQDKVANVATVFNTGIPQAHADKAARQLFKIRDTWVPFAALEALPKELVACSLTKEAAARMLSAMSGGDGREATQALSTLEASDLDQMARLLLHETNAA